MKKFAFLILTMSFILSACSNDEVETMSQYGNTLQDFEVVDQNEDTFTKDDMEGKVWLVDFIFTNCTTVCPPMTQNMVSVVEELEDEGVEDYGILSFTVDPERDSPETLQDYTETHHIPDDSVDWHLVTDYDYDFIRDFSEKNFKSIVAPPPEGSDQVTHGTSFYLIDENGKIIKDYAGTDSGDTKFPREEIIKDMKKMTKNL